MSNDWKAFRASLEELGVLFPDADAAKIPRVQKKNKNRWNHIRRLLRLLQKRAPHLVANEELDIDAVFQELLVITKKTESVIYDLDELLEILYDIDQMEGEFDFRKASSSDYAKRLKQAFSIGKQEYSWRAGKTKEDFEPKFLIGAPPEIPRPPEEEEGE